MAVSLTVLKETGDETRVSATPETVKKMTGLGIKVTVEAGAGEASGFADVDYKKAGAIAAAAGRKRMGAAKFNAKAAAGRRASIRARKAGKTYKG